MTPTAGHLTMNQQTGSSSLTTYFTPSGSPVTLANVGDSLKVTWVFTPNGAVAQSNTSQNFRFGLGRIQPWLLAWQPMVLPTAGTYTGYAMFMQHEHCDRCHSYGEFGK